MSGESKKTADEGRFSSPTGAPGGADLLGEVARGVGQRGAGKRSQEFVAKIANAYGMLPGDLLAATLMKGLREHVEGGGDPGAFLQERAVALSKTLRCKVEVAFAHLVAVAKELMPYVHQKQPMAIDVNQQSIAFVVQAQAGQAPGAGPGGLDLRPADVRETPMKSVAGPARSDGAGRMDTPSALKTQEEQGS